MDDPGSLRFNPNKLRNWETENLLHECHFFIVKHFYFFLNEVLLYKMFSKNFMILDIFPETSSIKRIRDVKNVISYFSQLLRVGIQRNRVNNRAAFADDEPQLRVSRINEDGIQLAVRVTLLSVAPASWKGDVTNLATQRQMTIIASANLLCLERFFDVYILIVYVCRFYLA